MILTPNQIASFPWHVIPRYCLQIWLDVQKETGHSQYLCHFAERTAGSYGRTAMSNWLQSVGISRCGAFYFPGFGPTIKAYPPGLADNVERRLHIVNQLLEGKKP